MTDYVGVTDVATKLFTWHASIIGWAIALVLLVLLLTKLWRHIWEFALLFDAIGWLCAMYAGFTSNWFIGWFAWVIPLSVVLFMRFTMEYMMNLPNAPDEEGQ